MKLDSPDLHQARIPETLAGLRLDQALSEIFPDYSRSRLQAWIRNNRVHVNGHCLRPKDRIEGGELVLLDAEPETVLNCEPQAIPLEIVYEDEWLIVINKPAGLVVHPAPGNPDGTLLNALLHYDATLAMLPRAGIIHRIDKDTSGLLIVARTLSAHTRLVERLQAREIGREYLAVTQGRMTAGGTVDEPIGRHPRDRKRYTVNLTGKPAVTHYRISERFRNHTLLRVRLETGRTHQIRVHLAHIRYPLVGDPVYGGRLQRPADCDNAMFNVLHDFRRQALHACRLTFAHPGSSVACEWQADLPKDFQGLLGALRAV